MDLNLLSWADRTHQTHQRSPWKPNSSWPTSLAFLSWALCKIQYLGLARERGLCNYTVFVCLFVCLNASKKSSSGTGIVHLLQVLKGFSGQFFSFSIRGFPATVRVAVHLLTLLKCSHFSIPWASFWLTSWLTAGQVSVDLKRHSSQEWLLWDSAAVSVEALALLDLSSLSLKLQALFSWSQTK